ncbi:hypothetical protein BGZ95_001361 [Linnemannia exigua]|uniref:Uncharacterized protein n=1 Tax=Linnemannia exigua TaxID=604196 RepID=A0AAD4H3S9_9FUNG|nr:hypothetical protein BGZ95_001361 [Linnemannia exigua]
MRITFSSISFLVLAVVSVTSAAPAKPSSPFRGKGKGQRLSRESVATLKKFGWLPANYTAPAGGFGPPLVPLEPSSVKVIGPIQGPSRAPSNARASGDYTCPGAKMYLEWWAKAPKAAKNREAADRKTEHRFNFIVTSNPQYNDFMRPQLSQGASPQFLETRLSADRKYDVTHDADWDTGHLIVTSNGQRINWDLVGRYLVDEDYSYYYIGNSVHACLNWFW